MIRLCGVCCLLGTGILAAAFSVREQKRRLSVPDGWITLIRYMRSEIDCFLTPVEEILRASQSPLLAFCKTEEAITLPVLFHATERYLSEEAGRILASFLKESGTLYREEQIKRCDDCLSGLTRERERVFAALPGSLRVSVALSLALPLGVAILLW